MRELIRTIGGAFAGAIYPFVVLHFALGPGFGSMYFLGQLYQYLLPGAIVGLVLWSLHARVRRTRDAMFRFAVGAAISLPVLVWIDWPDLRWGFRHEGEVSFVATLSGVIGILMQSAAIGGV